jgi:hypothetical protein
MTLQRAQIEVLLEDLEATALRRHRADPGDPTLSRDIVEQARALLRVATIDQHLHICDHAQHLLLRLGGEGEHEAETQAATVPVPVDDGILRAVQPTRERIPDLGIALVDDPFDLDAYVPREPAAAPARVRMLQAPHAVHVVAPLRSATPLHHEPRHGASAAPQPAADPERRAGEVDESELRRGLTAQQLHTLDTMSHFGWTLRFVRRPLFQPPLPVAFDRNRERFVVIGSDGSIDDAPGLQVRD